MLCPACGNPNRDGARFCDSCGTGLAAPDSAADGGQRPGVSSPGPRGAVAPEVPALIAGRYRIDGRIGESSRRQVLLATDVRDDRELALTLFSPETMDEAALARSRREIGAMEHLGEHPHVVSVIETGEDAGRPFVVSMHMPGGDMRTRLADATGGRIQVPDAVAVAIQICRALEHAHGCGIVHRDLKPANVWLDDEGNARLGGFGLSSTGPARGGGVVIGTVAYLPPEQALGHSAGPRADLYSLGALIYEMLCGQPPFAGDDAVSIIGQHLNAEPVPPSRHNPAVPPGLDQLVGDLLAKRPDDRPVSAAAVRERLEGLDLEAPDRGSERDERPLEALAGGVFVGRDAELATLREAADAAMRGKGRLVLLAGEPGIGKTRTAEELATYARLGGAKVHWGRCHEGDVAPAYWPWTQAIRSYVKDADPVALAWEMGASASEIARIVPEVAEMAGVGETGPAPEDEQSRFRLFDAVETFLRGASSSRPLVIILDDLHWADESSLRLLEFCARGLAGSSLMILGTYRDVELGRHHPLSRVLADLSRSGRATSVHLRGLGEPDVRRYVEMATGERDASLAASVHAQTEGNPFFVGEVMRLLASQGNLGGRDGGVTSIPQGVREVVGRRLDSLTPAANEALRTAAAIGREFDHEVLEDLVGLDPSALDRAIEEAVAARLVDRVAPGRLRFSHALVRETLYGELDPARLPLVHRDIALSLERLYRDDPEGLERNLGSLAHHFHQAGVAGDPALTVDYAMRAGRRASAQLGYDEAAQHFGRALAALELADPDPVLRVELLVSRGESELRSGEPLRASETLQEAGRCAQELGDSSLLLRAIRGISLSAEAGRAHPEVVELIEATLDLVGPGDSAERSELLIWLAQMYYWVDPQGRASPLFAEGVEMARRIDDDSTLAFALIRAALADLRPLRQRTEDAAAEATELAQRIGDRETEMRGHVFELRNNLTRGDIAAVDRDLIQFARIARELREPQHLWHVPMLQSMRATIDGDFEEAEELAELARELGERAQEPISLQFYAIQTAFRFRLQGRQGEIAETIFELTERYPGIPAWRVAAASLRAEMGDMDIARTEFERLTADGVVGLPRDAQWPTSLAILCDLAFQLDEAERAEELHELMAPYSGEVIVVGRATVSWGPVDRALGLASAAAGRLDRALEELEAALRLAEHMGDRPFTALIELDIATTALRRRDAGDRERALELLDNCLDAAQRIGMRALSERALALKLETQGIAGVDVTTSIGDVIDAVESERPDVRGYAAADGTVTILFSDIEASTRMTERLGDERWLGVLRNHNRVFRERLQARGGYEVKNQGDGFMLVFPDPAEALRCAVEVQEDLAARAEECPEEGVRVRMGIHTGEAIASEGDFFGRNVILAARIAAVARGGEVLVSDALRERVDGEAGLGFEEGRELELKGLAGTHRVYGALVS